MNYQEMLRDHILNKSPTQLVMLRAPLEVSMLCQRFRTLIISIQDSRLGLEKTKLVGKLANVDDFCSTRTDGNKLRFSCRERKDRCKSSFPCERSVVDKEVIAIG